MFYDFVVSDLVGNKDSANLCGLNIDQMRAFDVRALD